MKYQLITLGCFIAGMIVGGLLTLAGFDAVLRRDKGQ